MASGSATAAAAALLLMLLLQSAGMYGLIFPAAHGHHIRE
jgi:hypothetical protein